MGTLTRLDSGDVVMTIGTTGAPSGGASGAPGGATPPDPDQPSQPSPVPQRRGLAQRLQESSRTSLWVAAIGAVAVVVAALISAWAATGSDSPPSANDSAKSTSKISISSWTEKRLDAKSTLYEFFGTADPIPPGTKVHVIAQLPPKSDSNKGGGDRVASNWLVSPEADIFDGGQWMIAWVIEKPPVNAVWSVILVDAKGAQVCDSCVSYIDALEAHGVDSSRVIEAHRILGEPKSHYNDRWDYFYPDPYRDLWNEDPWKYGEPG